MKTKNMIKFGLLLVVVLVISSTGCRKKKDSDNASITQLSKDENDVQSASDDAANDVSDMLSKGTSKSVEGFLCNATIDSSVVINDTIKYFITYTGGICHGKKREGSVEIKKKVGMHWRDVGATVHIKFNNLKITKVASGRYIKLNGFKALINVSGGVVRELDGNGSIVHTVSGSLSAEFDNGTTRIWNVARKRTYAGTQNNLVVTVEGIGSADGFTNLVTWGTNRHGEQFYTQIITPIIHKQLCDWDPTFGIKIHNIPSQDKKATITFGYDTSGNASSASSCPTHCKVDWQKGNKTGSMLHAI